ncbi:MAG: DUF5996 family protein [Sphingomicrobium sp.]
MAGKWPSFEVERDWPTIAFLHLASQMPGKMRVAYAPWVNHGWHVTLLLVGDGLTTAPIACADGRTFTLAIDLCAHGLALHVSDGTRDIAPFRDGMSIAEFHRDFIAMLDRNHLPSTFHGTPNELADAIPFAEDHQPRPYRRSSAETFHAMLSSVVPVFDLFRAGFSGKSSPVHFFWGSFDLAVTRFSGRAAPPHPGGVPGLPDRITREAYSDEESSAGFWPGNAGIKAEPIFYSYAYPEPKGFRESEIEPPAAKFDPDLGEFTLAYELVRRAADPEAMLTSFLQSTYRAAATLADWDRKHLERAPVAP